MRQKNDKLDTVHRKRLPWYHAPPFLLFWVLLVFAIVIPLFNRLPDIVKVKDEPSKPGEFVAERAQQLLYSYDRIGPKVVGSIANEVTTVSFLLEALEKVRIDMRKDLYDLELDVQQVSGAYVLNSMVNMYQGIQNVVVKLSTRSSNSSSYLLVNSHFDSKPGSPGTGDDGIMVVVMLEVLRQMAISPTVFEHPIVFLFNGAEENPLQASHGFITQHKWATNCKALINLDVGGSGGRDILFQSGPDHPWLMKYYKQNAIHPFATTLAEEIFQSGMLPSDTDFRIFRDFGHVPGLDMAQIKNGYVYHTAFDNFAVIPGRSVQSTGENVLALVRAFTNASEMLNPQDHSEGHSVFFDFLGLFLVYYTETTGIILNCCVAVISLVLVAVSLWRIARVSQRSLNRVLIDFVIILALCIVGYLLCIGLSLLMAVIFDAGDRSLTYFSNNWLVFGLYICPGVIGLALPLTLYYSLRPCNEISHSYQLQMGLHSHCVILAVVAIILTSIGIRSTYLCMISLIFYEAALLINLLSTLHDRGLRWVIFVGVLQMLPFLYICYLFYTFLVVFFPMMGRNGTTTNPDIMIALVCALGTLLALGFVAPLINIFRWPKLILLGLCLVTFVFCMIAVSSIGFPYRAKTSAMRITILHTRRTFYDYDGSLSVNDSGYYFDYQDRRTYLPFVDSVDLTGLDGVSSYCDKYVMCGLPCFWNSWCGARAHAGWLPRADEVILPGTVTLDLQAKTILPSGKTVRFEFELNGPHHMNLYIQPLEDVELEGWSFISDIPTRLPYHIYFSYGSDNSSLKFHIDFNVSNGSDNFNRPIFELGVVGQYVSNDYNRDNVTLDFLNSFPDFVYVMEWTSYFQRFVF
ncbi:uncharacterized protein Dwil_GK23251 [Drosophila willistoni]|uniref:FXNA-like protease n=1 Tax=Drosophila willistoni TaxID=7260 RepID=B4NN42_DROWI|nr:endoplasmic reticulum metallopeptidase 1 [Drosophila willistoni]EDW85781.2 uncharacterized protein Dwil_GK23251 [Drosophila willistoni]